MNRLKYVVVLAVLTLMAACGGGGGGSSSSGTPTTVSGVASKGIITDGTVAVYPVSAAGTKGSTPLAVGRINPADNGAYSVNIGSYSGPVVVEVTGKYTDEATGREISVPASAPLHAALDYVTSGRSFTLPVTPLTELAYRQAGPLTPANIRGANDMISYSMRLDIINTKPVAPTEEAFAGATQSQKNYALILAAVSQVMATDNSSLDQTLAKLNSGLSTTATAAALNQALTEYIDNANNTTGEKTVPSSLQNVGTVGKKLTLSLSGSGVASVQALSATLTLPDGLIMRADNQGVPLAEVLKLSGSAATAPNVLYTANYTAASGGAPATISLVLLAPSGNLIAGDVFAITCDTAAGSTPPGVNAVTLSRVEFWNQDGATLPVSDRPTLSIH